MFYYGARNGSIPLINFILDRLRAQGMKEEDIKNKVINGRFERTLSTPIIRACHSENVELVAYLIETLKARLDILNKNDENCLIVAVRNRNPFVVDYLVSNCKDKINIDLECSRNGLTAFARACLLNEFDIANILLSKGQANREYVNREGKSVLDLVIKAKNNLAI